MKANKERLERLKAVAAITKRHADPWGRCKGPEGGAAAGGNGIRLRNCIRRFQLEKHINEDDIKEVR